MITCAKCGGKVGVVGRCRTCAKNEKLPAPITGANVRGLIKHYDRMSKMKGAVNYDLVARLLRELLVLRTGSSRGEKP